MPPMATTGSQAALKALAEPSRVAMLRLVRDADGRVTRLYWATYPFTRTPEVFGPSS